MAKKTSIRFLVSALDWGMGHTTRMVPIMQYLQHIGHQVVFAGNSWQRAFIDKICPGIETINLEGYNIQYAQLGWLNKLRLLAQAPHILKSIAKEQDWLQQHIGTIKPDIIISDNRYGIHSPNCYSVILTHQLEIQSGAGSFANRALMRAHYKQLAPFNEVWVPDIKEAPGLAGRLSHPTSTPTNTHYIGLLSQFAESTTVVREEDYILALLSGPEPQRSILEQMLMNQYKQGMPELVIVGGVDTMPQHLPEGIAYHTRMGGEELKNIISGASGIICRSGYSTIMDLIYLQKKPFMIPTPGQTEQEYLAKKLAEEGTISFVAQHQFQLTKAITALKTSSTANKFPKEYYLQYQNRINSLIAKIGI